MPKKPNLLAFVISLLIIISLFVPLVGLLLGYESPNYSKEPLHEKPAFAFSAEFSVAFDNWWSEHFPLRSYLVGTYDQIISSIFRASGNDQVIHGKAGWYYFQPTLKDYLNTPYLTANDTARIGEVFRIQHDVLENNGIDSLIVFVPNKSTIYPEYMPDYYRPLIADGPYERMLGAIPEALDLKPLLSKAKSDYEYLIYHKEDSHWTKLGAYLAYQEIIKQLDLEDHLKNYQAIEVEDMWEGDLTNMLYPAEIANDDQIVFKDFKKNYIFTRPIRTLEDIEIESKNPGSNGKLLIFRDSFSNALIDFFSNSFDTVHYSRAIPYRYTLLDQVKPEAVIFQLTERNFDYWHQVVPIMESPLVKPEEQVLSGDVRESAEIMVDLTQAKKDKLFLASFTFADQIEGEKITQVLAFNGNDWFRAFPITEDQDITDQKWQYGFSLYSKQKMDWQRILYCLDGEWFSADLNVSQVTDFDDPAN